jgi:hypothetical protein
MPFSIAMSALQFGLIVLNRDQHFSRFRLCGLRDGVRWLELRDFFSQWDHFLFQPAHSRLGGVGRVRAVPLALQTIPGRLSKPIGRALSRFLNGFHRVGIHAERDLLHKNPIASFSWQAIGLIRVNDEKFK